MPYNMLTLYFHGIIRRLGRLLSDLLSFEMGSVAGVLGLSSELDDVSFDASEFLLTKANNLIEIFVHEDNPPCDLSHPEKPVCRNVSTIWLLHFFPLEIWNDRSIERQR